MPSPAERPKPQKHPNFSVHVLDRAALTRIERAAKRAKLTRSSFVFNAALEAAEKILGGKKKKAA